jgi:RNA polymerase sigma factor (TIGR02999 family)
MVGIPSQHGPSDSAASLGTPEECFALLYRELHDLARHHLQHQAQGFSLGTTTLLHEAYLNVSARRDARFPDRSRFLGYASKAMRGLIVDYARRRSAAKRGGEFHLLPLEEGDAEVPANEATNLGELSEALDQLAGVDAALAELVDLHFFCGLDFVEIAGLRGVSERTVQRDWRKARVLLHQALRADEPADTHGA